MAAVRLSAADEKSGVNVALHDGVRVQCEESPRVGARIEQLRGGGERHALGWATAGWVGGCGVGQQTSVSSGRRRRRGGSAVGGGERILKNDRNPATRVLTGVLK